MSINHKLRQGSCVTNILIYIHARLYHTMHDFIFIQLQSHIWCLNLLYLFKNSKENLIETKHAQFGMVKFCCKKIMTLAQKMN